MVLTNILTEDFTKFAIALTLLMLGNTITGVMKSITKGEFDPKVLAMGVSNYLCWLIGCCCTVAGMQIFGGDLSISIGDNSYTFLQAIELAKKAVYVYWGAKAIQNFLEYSGTNKEVTPEYPQELADFNISSDDEGMEGRG